MPVTPYRYRAPDEDSGRWAGFQFRPGDIVISTRSKSGTTWMQMICALLVFKTPDLPHPLTEISPWLDWTGAPVQSLFAHLGAQRHRRFFKTHTPLDGVPIDPRASYIVVARHPLDAAVSLYHQGDNIDRERLRELTGASAPDPDEPEKTREPVRDWLLDWIAEKADPREHLDSLPGFMHHLADAWSRREESNVLLVHYEDLSADLDAKMGRVADWLGVDLPAAERSELVRAASFETMKRNSAALAPNQGGIFKDTGRFFRRGRSGSGTDLLTAGELDEYRERCAALAPAGLLEWLHRGR